MCLLNEYELNFYDFCGFRSVAVNSVYKLQFFTFIQCKICRTPLYKTSRSAVKKSRISTLKKHTLELFCKCFSVSEIVQIRRKTVPRQLDQNSRNYVHQIQFLSLAEHSLQYQLISASQPVSAAGCRNCR